MSTACPACSGSRVVATVPSPLRDVFDSHAERVWICERCLATEATEEPDDGWDPAQTNTALPSEPGAAVGVAILVGLLESLALNRESVIETVEYLEGTGEDPLLAIDRIRTTPTLEPPADLDRRRVQLAQVLGRKD